MHNDKMNEAEDRGGDAYLAKAVGGAGDTLV
jgi:hypothetical protein